MHICDLPDREVLMDSLVATNSCGNANEAANWAHPAHVFPRLLPFYRLYYFRAVVNGLVIAIGGLSETVGEYEDSIAVHQDGFHTTINETRRISYFSYERHSGDDRVVVPLLKTLLLLLRNGAFENSVFEHPGPEGISSSESVAQQFLTLSHQSTSPPPISKIRLCLDMFLQLLLYCEPVRGKSYKYLVICLGHNNTPRVRKYAAEQLYLQLLSDRAGVGIVTSAELDKAASVESSRSASDRKRIVSGLAPSPAALEAAQELLVTTAWDGLTSEARGMRQKFCDTVGLVMGKKTTESSKGNENKPKRQDELDSYAALVADAGY